MLKNCVLIGILIFMGLVYYEASLSRSDTLRKSAFFMKIFLLSLSFILAFAEQEFIIISGMALGGKSSVMMLILIEIVDALIDKKKEKYKIKK